IQGVKNLNFLVGFDPKVLKAVDVIEGSFLKQGNSPTQLTKVIDQTSGQILVNLSSSATTGASGIGSLVAIVFEVTRAVSQSQITTSQILPIGSGGETLAFNAPPPYAIEVGQ
ncbi:MAG TPA: cohesin domain-containing protein, partial [Sideroxyarcus sp.]|nr:cohesin domain-containing protein [Sideroxyarcus sp.]